MDLSQIEIKNKDIQVPEHIVDIWQRLVDAIAALLEVPSAMINRLESPHLDVFRSNLGAKNPFPTGTRMPMAGVYCESAAKRRQKVTVTDARTDPEWMNSPTARAGINAYLGFPLLWPDGDIFGTLCVIDTKERQWGELHESLLATFREAVEEHLALASTLKQLDEQNRSLEQALAQQKLAEQELDAERQRLANIIEGAKAGTWEWNVERNEFIVNERWAEIIGYTLAETAPLFQGRMRAVIHPDDYDAAMAAVAKVVNNETGYYDYEARMRHKDGHWVWTHARGKVTRRDADGKPLVVCGTQLDVSERKAAEEKIRYLATHDMLTGLPRMCLAEDRLAMALSFAQRYQTRAGVMFIDLDNFKKVNDTFGHDAGDLALQQAAQRMTACLRQNDTVARIGGDEFLLVATGLREPADAGRIAAKIIQLIAQPMMIRGQEVTLGASVGIALYPDDSADPDRLVKLADAAMYAVKNSRKNGYTFYGSSSLTDA